MAIKAVTARITQPTGPIRISNATPKPPTATESPRMATPAIIPTDCKLAKRVNNPPIVVAMRVKPEATAGPLMPSKPSAVLSKYVPTAPARAARERLPVAAAARPAVPT